MKNKAINKIIHQFMTQLMKVKLKQINNKGKCSKEKKKESLKTGKENKRNKMAQHFQNRKLI